MVVKTDGCMRTMNVGFIWKDMKAADMKQIMKRFESHQLFMPNCIDMVIQARLTPCLTGLPAS